MKNEYGKDRKQVNNRCAQRCAPVYTKRVRDESTQSIHQYRANSDGRRGVYSCVSDVRGVLFTIITFASAVLTATYCDQVEENAVVVSWLLFAMSVIWYDPARILHKWLAKESRFLIVFSLVMSLGAWFIERLIPAAFFVIIVSGVLIFFKNSLWVEAESWRMTRTVERAMSRVDTDSVSGSWLRHRPEVRAMMHEAGYSLQDKELDTFINDAWSLGYLHGNRAEVNAEKLKSDSKAIKAENKSLKEQLSQRVNPDQRLIERNNELEKALRDNVSLLKQREVELESLRADVEAYRARFEALEDEAEEITEEPASVVILPDMSLYERILASDGSVRTTANLLGCKPWVIQSTRTAKKLFLEGLSVDEVKESSKLSREALEEIKELIA